MCLFDGGVTPTFYHFSPEKYTFEKTNNQLIKNQLIAELGKKVHFGISFFLVLI